MEDMENTRLRQMCGRNADSISTKADLLQMALDTEDLTAALVYCREIKEQLGLIETSAAFAYKKDMQRSVEGF